jgi:mRNA interferase MazF
MASKKQSIKNLTSGSVVFIDLGNAPFGHEQSGLRPGVVLSEQNGVVIIIPLTTNTAALRFLATYAIADDKQNGLTTPSIALVFQMRAVDVGRIVKRLGSVSIKDARALNKIIRTVTSL